MNNFITPFQESNRYLLWIFLVGIALGIANYTLGIWPTLGQSLIQQIIMSFVIGYSLIFASISSKDWLPIDFQEWQKYGILFLIFGLIGTMGTETEALVKRFLFQQDSYQFLGNHGYIFNIVLSMILGFMTYSWINLKSAKSIPTEELIKEEEVLTSIPIKQGEAILLHPIETIIFFEAYDNYSFLHDLEGNRYLCNYSLIFLEQRLIPNFLRIHRKYLLNKNHIHQVKPHLKGRFVIEFKDKNRTTINSSTTYSEVIKELIKL